MRCFCRCAATASRVRPAAAGPICSSTAAGAAQGPSASAASWNALCSCGVHRSCVQTVDHQHSEPCFAIASAVAAVLVSAGTGNSMRCADVSQRSALQTGSVRIRHNGALTWPFLGDPADEQGSRGIAPAAHALMPNGVDTPVPPPAAALLPSNTTCAGAHKSQTQLVNCSRRHAQLGP